MSDENLLKHLEGCKLNEKRYIKLVGILNKMRDNSSNSHGLLEKFADKCYKNEPDREVALQQAQQFLEALFGTCDEIFSLGPEKAVVNRIRALYELITPVEIRPNRSEKFNVLKHGRLLKKAKNIESSEIWEFKLDRFLVGPTLGVGGTATVKLAYDTTEREQVALKILQPKYAQSAHKEIDILRKLKHKNIIRIFECFDNVMWQKKKTTVFAIELANGGELIEYLMYTAKFEAPLARWFFKKLVAGVEYCHDQGVVHRDLKHDNCLLGSDFDLKITDFGFARKYFRDNKKQMETAIGTAQYAAPEILAQESYGEKVDIFSMGVMLFIALAGSQPWRKADPHNDKWYNWAYNKKWDKFWEYHGKRSHQFSSDAKDLLEGMLAHKAKKRWSLKDIQDSEWFGGKSYDNLEAERYLKKRKKEMDQKKFDAAERVMTSRKAVDMDSLDEDTKNLMAKANPPLPDIIRLPLTHFYTDDNAVIVFQKIEETIGKLKGDKKTVDKQKFEMTFEVKMEHTLQGSKKDTKEDLVYVVPGKVNIYRAPEEKVKDSRRNLVVFSALRDFNSRMYLPRVYRHMMQHIAWLRSDVTKSEESKEDE